MANIYLATTQASTASQPNVTYPIDTPVVIPTKNFDALSDAMQNGNQTTIPNNPGTGQTIQQINPSGNGIKAAQTGVKNPCDLFGCLGSFKNNSRYQSGTAGQIASNIAVDIAVLMTYVAGSIAIIFVLVGAFKMLTSEGDTKKYEDGLKSIRYAITGLVFSVLAYALIAVVLQVLGSWSV